MSKTETKSAVDYSQYASMAETPEASSRRAFDFLSLSGEIRTEVVTDKEGNEMEKRLPASAYRLYLTQPKLADGRFKSEEVKLPLTIIPIKYRMVMEQKAGAKGEVLVLKSSEYNGKQSDKVVISRFSPEGKVIEKYGPMTAMEARQQFKNAEGKNVLKDKAHVYALFGTDLVRFVVKGTGLWEDRSTLPNGKSDASRAPYPFLNEYFSTFAINDPYFLYEMNVGAIHRDHGTVKYYRPVFARGARISADVEATVLEHLKDLHAYFTDMDEATSKFTPTSKTAPVGISMEVPEYTQGETVIADTINPEDVPF